MKQKRNAFTNRTKGEKATPVETVVATRPIKAACPVVNNPQRSNKSIEPF